MKDCQALQNYKSRLKGQKLLLATPFTQRAHYLTKQFKNIGIDVFVTDDITTLEKSCDDSKAIDILLIDFQKDSVDQNVIKSLKQQCCHKIFLFIDKRKNTLDDALFEYGIIDYYDSTLADSQLFEDVSYELMKIERNKTFTIMVAENSPVIKKQLQDLLVPRGFDPVFVSHGNQMITQVETVDPDLVLLDSNLPDIDSKTALLQLHKRLPRQQPVVVISDSEDINLFSRVLKNGARDYIKKPFILEEVLIKIDMWVEMAHRKHQRDCQEQLLNEYKDAIDESTIVSKTDLSGVITYVNKAFCEISGYSKEELLGKPHNIVRHPDMPKYAFEDMWRTIKAQKLWRGVVKNRRKSGDYYYVETIIKPIIDSSGNTREYIGIRTDITEIENIKNSLQKRLNITNQSFKEVLSLSKEYEKALDESTIVSRTDLSGKIIYANERFFEITGFTKEEVIGRTHAIVKHEENSINFYKQMWETIQAGKIWRGTIKNRRKDGSEYIVNSLIYPVKNSEQKVVEYMAIRNDITHIVKLHKEIEDTQREVIYKMGEVGESRSKETGDHVKRVAEYSYLLARKYGLSHKTAKLLKNASPMHDIGKVGISDSILLKPAKLTQKEYEIMKTHATIGYSILKNSSRELLQTAAIVAHEHHEKYDGSGYPRGIKGEDIHIFGRITAVADVFDALAHDRVYKKAWEIPRIIELFKEQKGSHFDPKLVDLFLGNLDEFLQIKAKYKD